MSHATYYVISTFSLSFASSVSTSICTYTLASMTIVVGSVLSNDASRLSDG
jgi:hypothetical protein